MSAQVFHHGPKPISTNEFRDAVESICRPRFPMARIARARPVALAISGGVDSMALAFLFSNLMRTYRFMNIADFPFNRAHCLVVDHRLRENSTAEAALVCQQLRKLDMRASLLSIHWKDEIRRGLHPPDLPNVESLARRYRYRVLGGNCTQIGATSLFFAHHRDDQYETILMRLLSGHGYRGWQGIREANEIPECYDLHKVYKSGLIDDQRSMNPFLSFKPPNKDMKLLRRSYRREGSRFTDVLASQTPFQSALLEFAARRTLQSGREVPYMAPLNTEDSGVTIYRPLLEFDKDRLIATCEANNVTWFEDATNKDPTLTTRNAIRSLVEHHVLPKALQKTSILALSQRARRRVKYEENAAERLLIRENVIKDFDSNVGTLLVQLPSFQTRTAHRSLWAEARELARIPSRRIIAAILIRKLIEYVTPDNFLPPLTHLDNFVDRLFPQLSTEPSATPASAFSIAGVWFSPVPDQKSTKWFLSRAPYASSKMAPEKLLGSPRFSEEDPVATLTDSTNRHGSWRGWKSFKLWDGRFWILASSCVHANFLIYPLLPEHLKPFREALPPQKRKRLESLLKYHAPGKIRYTLPGLYSIDSNAANGGPRTMTLLALPSLGISVPGMERWVRYDIRYRHVDLSLLRRQRTHHRLPQSMLRSSCSQSRKLRGRRLAGRISRGHAGEHIDHVEQSSE